MTALANYSLIRLAGAEWRRRVARAEPFRGRGVGRGPVGPLPTGTELALACRAWVMNVKVAVAVLLI